MKGLALRFPSIALVLIGAGPPCQGVSGLNASKKGALRDARSCLFQEAPRIKELFKASLSLGPGAAVDGISCIHV